MNLAGNCSRDAGQNRGAKILRAGAEIALNHRGGRNKSSGRVRSRILAGDGVLIAEEEEQLVLDYGSADGAAELVALERVAGRREEIARVQIAVAQELERVAMEGIGAGSGNSR